MRRLDDAHFRWGARDSTASSWVYHPRAEPTRTSNPSPQAPVPSPGSPKLLERVRASIRTRHYSRRTEEAYTGGIRRFVAFHGSRHPAELGRREVAQFLSALAVEGRVSAATQNQALSALLFLYQGEALKRTKRSRRSVRRPGISRIDQP